MTSSSSHPFACRPLYGSRRGFTLVELSFSLVLIAVLASILAPALAANRGETQIAHCANNLRLLAAANHMHADDFKGKFFYHWEPKGVLPYPGAEPRRWHEESGIGQYIYGKPIGAFVDKFGQEHEGSNGLGGRNFTCPADAEGSIRSYNQNFWAAGLALDIAGPERDYFSKGSMFDRTANDLSRLILFAEVITITRTTDGWVSAPLWGGAAVSPGLRFGNGRWTGYTHLQDRTHSFAAATLLDYSRHSESSRMGDDVGASNFAVADGSVVFLDSDDLFDRATGRSKFRLLWSPDDEKLEGQE